MEITVINRCCGKGTREANILIKALKEKGIEAKVRLLHQEAGFMKKYNITKEMLKNTQYIILDHKNMCFPVCFINKSDFKDNLLKTIMR